MFLRRHCYILITLCLVLGAAILPAQQIGVIRGTVLDDTSSPIPGVAVSATGQGVTKKAETDITGAYSIAGLPPGNYTVIATRSGFAPFTAKLTVLAGRPMKVDVAMKLEASKQEVTVQGDPVGTVSVDATQNAGALVLRQEEIDALPDDPDDLASDLQALAGPAAGPNGGQIFIDGFTGGRLPPKESIREIRVNQNPFSSEYDRIGFGRIEILTKPGTDKLRGQVFFNDSEKAFDARNPYTSVYPDFSSRQYGGNISDSLGKRASVFVDFERRDVSDAAVANGQLVDSNFNIVPFGISTPQPQHRTTVSPRVDYQLNANNTLVMRYSYERNDQANAGLGFFDLATRGNHMFQQEHSIALTETAVLGARVINETRFRLEDNTTNQTAVSNAPGIQVSGAFSGGGSGIGSARNTDKNYELQNYTSVSSGTHAFKFGVRVRVDDISSQAPSNFNGNFSFQGSLGPVLDAGNNASAAAVAACTSLPRPNPDPCALSSIEQYRRTLLFSQLGYSPQLIRQLGGGASQFLISGGNPRANLTQFDEGIFFQDDWRVKPNFTLSLGLRYELQNNISDWRDIAPRVGFAWSPDSHGGKPGKTVIRGGSGIFYDRVNNSLTLAALRFNGVTQQRYIVSDPLFFGDVPSIDQLNARVLPQTIQQKESNLRAPYLIQTAMGVERQLPHNTTVAVNFTVTRGVHELLERNVNAPLPGSISADNPAGIRPYGSGNLYQYESDGVLNQNQIIVNTNSRMTRSINFFAFYVFNHARSNTDGPGTFPADQYNTRLDYGRSGQDIRHRFVMGGSLATKWAVRLSPFIIARSGMPYNITTGQDFYGDSVFTARPSLIGGCTEIVRSCFNVNPGPNDIPIPRNFAQGPASLTVNLRLSKVFGFGESTGRGGGGVGGPMHGPVFVGGPGGRGHGRGPGGPGGFDGSTSHRYNLTLSASARNVFNTNNPGNPIGVLSSPLFGVSNSLSGGFGPGGTSVTNRRLELSLRFSF
ncbi:MAG TPA: TonB-dependent receptor [Solibacterales bacterium]|nr:TonB-dependent receptor [Bryobacterales bacterium]